MERARKQDTSVDRLMKAPGCSRLKNLLTLLEMHVSSSLPNTYTHTGPINTTKPHIKQAAKHSFLGLPHSSLPPASSLSSSGLNLRPHLAMGGASDLPPGFHFFPSDEELIVHFLRRKASLLPCQPDIVPTILLNHYDPWELNGMHLLSANDIFLSTSLFGVRVMSWLLATTFFLDKALQAGNQWYFFSHATQSRVTPNGYWSSICADETVKSGGCNIGLKKTLVFSIGESSEGIETNWIMHEYHLLDGRKVCSSSTSTSSSRKLHREKGHSNTVRATYTFVYFI